VCLLLEVARFLMPRDALCFRSSPCVTGQTHELLLCVCCLCRCGIQAMTAAVAAPPRLGLAGGLPHAGVPLLYIAAGQQEVGLWDVLDGRCHQVRCAHTVQRMPGVHACSIYCWVERLGVVLPRVCGGTSSMEGSW
jgi:hypothetical protein